MELSYGLSNSTDKLEYGSRYTTNVLKYGSTNITNVSLDYEIGSDIGENIFSEPANVIIVILSIIGLVANTLTIIATAHIPGRQTTHSKLIISLCIADTCITVSVFLHVLVKVTSPLLPPDCLVVANKGFLCFALLASLINLLVMGIDHFIAVIRPLHYHLIMSPTRANIMLIVIWIICALVGGFLEVIVGAFQNDINEENFCRQVNMDSFDAQLPVLCLVVLQMFVLIYLYCHIFHIIKTSTYMLQLNAQSLLRDSGNTHFHSRKAIITTIIIVGTFMVTWVPYSVYHITGIIMFNACNNPENLVKFIDVFIKIHNILWIMVQCNCIFDPLIYAVRTPAVQQGYKNLMNKLNLRHTTENGTPSSCSHRALARTYSSEMDVQLAQDTDVNNIKMESFGMKDGSHIDTKLEIDRSHSEHNLKNHLLPHSRLTNNNGK